MLNTKLILDYVLTQFRLKYQTDKNFFKINYSDLTPEDSRININSSGLDFLNKVDPIPDKIVFKNFYNQEILFYSVIIKRILLQLNTEMQNCLITGKKFLIT